MIEDEFDPVEYLKYIKREESKFLLKLRITDRLEEYILYTNRKMLEEYPDMVLEVIDDNDMDRRQ